MMVRMIHLVGARRGHNSTPARGPAGRPWSGLPGLHGGAARSARGRRRGFPRSRRSRSPSAVYDRDEGADGL